jgi:hypothetical protein
LTQPTLSGDFRVVGFPVNDPVDHKRGIASQNQAIELGTVEFGDGLCFGSSQQSDHVVRRKLARGRNNRVFVDVRRVGDGLDSGRSKCRKSRGRSRGEVKAHSPTLSPS